jgi:hypothetical protein
MGTNDDYELKRIETRPDILTYLDRLKYALIHQRVKIEFQEKRLVDSQRNRLYTNEYTIHNLFPNEDEIIVLKRELASLDVKEYIETVKDTRYKKRSEMRVFGRKYNGQDVYIKIRVELINPMGDNYIFVMSFHYAEEDFIDANFPYK